MHLLLVAYLLLFSGVPALTVPFPTIQLEKLSPAGLRIAAVNQPGMSRVDFNININNPVTADFEGILSRTVTEPTNGRWVLEITESVVDYNANVYYAIAVYYGTETVDKRGNIILDAPVVFDPRETSSVSANLTLPSGCERSPTTVLGKPVCKGELIFEDNFDTLDWTKWSREIRVSLDADGAGFVSYQRRTENLYVKKGLLHIVPSMLYHMRGFDKVSIFKGKLDLREFCTGIVDMTNECSRQAKFAQILPPVISARVRTRHFFSFRYGKVEVRAKLPKGDWLSPLILLEPLENYYGISDYASGQMRVAWTPGNKLLVDVNGSDISGKRISGGPLLAIGHTLRDGWFNGPLQQTHLGDDFHIYTLTWTEDSITLELDGHRYAVIAGGFANRLRTIKPYTKHWENGHSMAPFDREFYLTLGVSVGGHHDFPDGCRTGNRRQEKPWENGDPKAVFKFFKDHDNWYNTWGGDNIGLQVDYIRVYAL